MGARFTAVAAGTLSSLGLMLVPVALAGKQIGTCSGCLFQFLTVISAPVLVGGGIAASRAFARPPLARTHRYCPTLHPSKAEQPLTCSCSHHLKDHPSTSCTVPRFVPSLTSLTSPLPVSSLSAL